MLCVFVVSGSVFVFLFKQKTAYEMRISDWSSDVCSSDLADTLNERVGTMTESMQEQSGATVNISDNIQDAAAGIESVSSNVHEISAAAGTAGTAAAAVSGAVEDRKSTRLNSSH